MYGTSQYDDLETKSRALAFAVLLPIIPMHQEGQEPSPTDAPTYGHCRTLLTRGAGGGVGQHPVADGGGDNILRV